MMPQTDSYDQSTPYCATFTYSDVPGYSILDCVMSPVSTDLLIDYNAVSTAVDDGNDPGGKTIIITVSGPVSTVPTTPTPTPTPTPTSTPLGAIIGGAVGGVAVLTILILGLVFLLRKKKNNKTQDASPDPRMSYVSGVGGGGNGGAHGPSPGNNYQYQQIDPVAMQQQYPPAGHVDNSQKPPFNIQTQSYDPLVSSTESPPPQEQGAAPAYQATQHQLPQQTQGAHEMPARGAGNVTELA